MTAGEAITTVPTVEAALVELIDRGYSLSVETRVEVHEHKVGPHPITYADKLIVAGPERVPDHLRETIIVNKPLFLAAACILNPPTSWLQDLAGRCKTGVVFVTTGEEHVEYRITLEVLAANIAGFVGLNAVEDRDRLEPIVRVALRLPDDAAAKRTGDVAKATRKGAPGRGRGPRLVYMGRGSKGCGVQLKPSRRREP